jgi:hypothetical protein
MMTPHEEELQGKMERGEILRADDPDVSAYRKVFHALGSKPEYQLSENFADRVIQKILVRETQKESSKDHWWLVTGIVMLVIVLIFAIVYSLKFSSISLHEPGFLSTVSKYKGLILTAVVLVLFFNKLEKKILAAKNI